MAVENSRRASDSRVSRRERRSVLHQHMPTIAAQTSAMPTAARWLTLAWLGNRQKTGAFGALDAVSCSQLDRSMG